MSAVFSLNERPVGEIWTDNIDGKRVVTMRDTSGNGCRSCAFSTLAGGACPGVVYDRHPCCSSDRRDGQEVYYRLLAFVPEAKAKPFVAGGLCGRAWNKRTASHC